jgi:class 3 adenylate cyclase
MIERRLAAMVVADVIGYSKLVGGDESGTLAQLQSLRAELIEPQLAKHTGGLFKAAGDGFLVEFSKSMCSCYRRRKGLTRPATLVLLGRRVYRRDYFDFRARTLAGQSQRVAGTPPCRYRPAYLCNRLHKLIAERTAVRPGSAGQFNGVGVGQDLATG